MNETAALLFPTGGYLWPGMGADLPGSAQESLLERAERALATCGVERGALGRLMAGEGQARRLRSGEGWVWEGDFPLSMSAQTLLGIALGFELIRVHGFPRAVAGESMGEIPATCVGQAMDVEAAVVLTYRWAEGFRAASNTLGLRMAVVEDLDEAELEAIAEVLEARVVVVDARRLLVVAVPMRYLARLEEAVGRLGGVVHVSNNHCAAHDARLREAPDAWYEYDSLLDTIGLRSAAIPILSSLNPGEQLVTPDDLRANRRASTFTRLRWNEAIRTLPHLGIRRLIVLGSPSSAYPLRKLRSEEPELHGTSIQVVGTLAGVASLSG
ncbi:MAG: hypothetical protein V2A73_10640 [Pseudomonadota bacterium]